MPLECKFRFLSSSAIPHLVPEPESGRGFDLVLMSEKGSSECVASLVSLTAPPRNYIDGEIS